MDHPRRSSLGSVRFRRLVLFTGLRKQHTVLRRVFVAHLVHRIREVKELAEGLAFTCAGHIALGVTQHSAGCNVNRAAAGYKIIARKVHRVTLGNVQIPDSRISFAQRQGDTLVVGATVDINRCRGPSRVTCGSRNGGIRRKKMLRRGVHRTPKRQASGSRFESTLRIHHSVAYNHAAWCGKWKIACHNQGAPLQIKPTRDIDTASQLHLGSLGGQVDVKG